MDNICHLAGGESLAWRWSQELTRHFSVWYIFGVFERILRFFNGQAELRAKADNVCVATVQARKPTAHEQHAPACTGGDEDASALPPDPAKIISLAEKAVEETDMERATQLFAKALAIAPVNPLVHYKYANFCKDRGDLESALHAYNRAILLEPTYANAFCNRGVVLQRLERNHEALADYEQAAALNPQDALTHYNMGVLLQAMENRDEALESFNRAIAMYPGYVGALCNRGILLQEQGRLDEAGVDYDRAIEIDRGFAHAYFSRGNLHHTKQELEAALADYDEVIRIDAHHADAYCNRGAVLAELRHDEAALASFNAAIQLRPSLAKAHGNLATTLLYLRQFSAAIASFDEAIALEPDLEFAVGMRRHAKMHLCDWAGLEADVRLLAAGVEAETAMAPPLAVLALVDSPRLHHKVAQKNVQEGHPTDDSLPPIPQRESTGRIRLGYFSADFCDHAVAILAAEFLELHDRSKFEVIAFSFGPDTQDAMRKRLEKSFDQFHHLRRQSDRDVALLARSLGIDIAVDLNGHTAGSRTGIFALRAAPIQVNFLGYPGTMGAPYIDYVIGDTTVIPVASQQHYSEKIIYLPDSFLPHDSGREVASRRFTREELGLPPRGVVFCCFNNSYKIMPDVFHTWMSILSRVDHSVLWLSQNNATATDNLRREARNRGIDPERLIFAQRMPLAAEHLGRLRAADLFLDTLPYNAHSTALDALWSGLPVLTRMGEGFAGRVGASVLNAVGLPKLVTSTAAEYEDLAVELAANPRRLAETKVTLAQNRLTTALFDTARFTKNLENAYESIHQRYHTNLPPDNIYVAG